MPSWSRSSRRDDDGHPAEGGVAGEPVDQEVIGDVVHADPGMLARHRQLDARAVVPEAMRQADDARHHAVRNFQRRLDAPDTRRDRDLGAVDEPVTGSVFRVHQERAARLAFDELCGVV